MNISQSICKNCDTVTVGKYCHNCGQSSSTGHIDSHYVMHEIQHSLLHVDKGIFYTIKELLIRPGCTIKEYLAGKRVSHFKPFAFVIILGTIYGFICHFLQTYPESSILAVDSQSETARYSNITLDWLYSHYSFAMLAFIPFYALGSYLVFRKEGYNYIEYLVICSYIVGIQILLFIAVYFIYYFTLSFWVVSAIFVISYLYHIWVFIQIFDKSSRTVVFFKTLLSMLLSFLFTMGITFLGSLIYIILRS